MSLACHMPSAHARVPGWFGGVSPSLSASDYSEMVLFGKDLNAALMSRLSELWAGLPLDYSLEYDLGGRLNPLVYDTPNGVVPLAFAQAWVARNWVTDYRESQDDKGHLTLTPEGEIIVWAFNE